MVELQSERGVSFRKVTYTESQATYKSWNVRGETMHAMSHSAGGAAETASSRKIQTYSSIPTDYIFQPVDFDMLLVSTFYPRLAVVSLLLLVTSVRPLSCFSTFQFLFSASILFWLRNLSFPLMKIRTSSHLWYLTLAFLYLMTGIFTTLGIKNLRNNNNNNNNNCNYRTQHSTVW